MAIQLEKGSKFDLQKYRPGLEKAIIAIGWDVSAAHFDADLTALMIGEDGKMPNDNFFVFYNNLLSPDGSMKHAGDNLTGKGDGDDEVLLINFAHIDPRIHQIILAISIHNAELRFQTFSMLSNFFFRIHDVDQDEEIVRYNLQEFGACTEMIIGRLVRQPKGWIFEASTVATSQGLQHIIDQFV